MNNHNDILSKFDRKDGLTVPDGYFADFSAKMTQALPYRAEAETPDNIIVPPATFWSRVRPYVYLAAMFAGIWCMLKMFSLSANPGGDSLNIDHNPVLAEALGNDSFFNEYIIDDIHQLDIIDDMIEDGLDLSMLDFDSDTDREVSFIDPATINITD